jgi:UDP:flavonoid glycosyltransferase YjiC (YdhE family)
VARVLFAWEFGGDLGHASRLVPIARELRRLGHEPLFAFRDLTLLGAFAAEDFEWFAAPRLRLPPAPNASPLSSSDILLNLGYADAPGLSGALRAWLSLLELAKPDLLVADYAPTALLAARSSNVPRLTIGTGFSVPSLAEPIPALRAWHPTDRATLERIDTGLVECVARAFEKLPRGGTSPRTARDVFDAEAHLLCTFPELDPFGPREGVEYLGPQGDPESGVDAAWTGSSPRVFAYLKPRDTRFGRVVEALAALGGEVHVAAPGLDPIQASALSKGSLRVHAAPLRLDGFLQDADLCVFHAGPGLAARALVAGVPMALLPMHLEQFLVGRRLVDSGVARMLAPEANLPDLAAWLAEAAGNPALKAAARDQAGKHAAYDFKDGAARTARRIAAELA